MKNDEWQPAGSAPEQVGVYETFRVSADSEGRTFQYWSGAHWGYCSPTVAQAREMAHQASILQRPDWRGPIDEE